MAEAKDVLDPRVVRTRMLLHRALEGLLREKDFDKISIQEIADAATVNRVTFYDHYKDKFALLGCMVGSRFQELLAERNVQFDGTCTSALTGIALAVFDYLAGMASGCGGEPERWLEPHLESAVIAVVREMILAGLKRHPAQISSPLTAEMSAAALSWAIYGVAKEWLLTPDRAPAEAVAGPLVARLQPLLGQARAGLLQ